MGRYKGKATSTGQCQPGNTTSRYSIIVVNHESPVLTRRNGQRWTSPIVEAWNCSSAWESTKVFEKLACPQHYSFDVKFSTGLSDGGEEITKWDLPSPNRWREHIKEHNDGSMPTNGALEQSSKHG